MNYLLYVDTYVSVSLVLLKSQKIVDDNQVANLLLTGLMKSLLEKSIIYKNTNNRLIKTIPSPAEAGLGIKVLTNYPCVKTLTFV